MKRSSLAYQSQGILPIGGDEYFTKAPRPLCSRAGEKTKVRVVFNQEDSGLT